MNVKLNGHKKKDPTTGLDDGSAVAALMKPFYQKLLADAFADAEGAGVPGIAFDLANPYVQGVLKDLAKKIKGVTETTKQEIREIVAEGIEKGWGVEGIQQAIRLRGTEASRTRAVLIARTETAAAYSQGSLAAYKASGVVSHTEWLTAGDDLDCPICAALGGTRAELGGSFDGGIDAPPAHPNCRCALSPVIDS